MSNVECRMTNVNKVPGSRTDGRGTQADILPRSSTIDARPFFRRRGFSSVMATIYVALFAGLAVAFVAFTSANTAISGNARDEQIAYLAAESGLSVVRYHLAGMTFPPDATSDEVFAEAGESLAGIFNATLNLMGRQVVVSSGAIQIPAIPLDANLPGAAFSAELTRDETNFLLTVTGQFGGVTRTISIQLAEGVGPPDASILRHGVASQGSIRIDGAAIMRSNVIGRGSVMSLDAAAMLPIRVNGSGQFDGDFYMIKDGVSGGDVFSSDTSRFLKSDGSGYETGADSHTHSGVESPAWPRVDTAPFKTLIDGLPKTRIERGADISALGPLHNLYIAANADPVFNSGTTITGLVYVEWPNDIVFSGSSNITGMIVCQPPPFEPAVGDAATNEITFRGAVTSQGVESLPQTAEYQGIHEHTGTYLLAPDYEVTFNGAMGTINGTLYASELTLNGATTGTVRGSILVDRRRQFTKMDSVDLFFEVDESEENSAGLVFDRLKTLTPVAGSYREL